MHSFLATLQNTAFYQDRYTSRNSVQGHDANHYPSLLFDSISTLLQLTTPHDIYEERKHLELMGMPKNRSYQKQSNSNSTESMNPLSNNKIKHVSSHAVKTKEQHFCTTSKNNVVQLDWQLKRRNNDNRLP